MKAASIVSLVAILLVGFCAGAAIPASKPITHFAVLTGDQQTVPTTSTAFGIGIFSYDTNSGILLYEVIHNVNGANGAHIHNGTVGVDGGVVIAFTISNAMTGSATLNAAQVNLLNNGGFYVNVHSATYAAGEIRGQILSQGQSVVSLLGSYQSPAVNTTASGHAFVTYGAQAKSVGWHIVHSVSAPTAIHFHGPANDTTNGGVEITVASDANGSASPVNGQATNVSTIVDFTSGLNYINVHSTPFSSGEIRGQDYYPNVMYAVALDGSQAGVTTTNIGAAVISVASDGSLASIAVMSTITTVTGLHIHAPASPGQTAGVAVPLTSAQASINHWTTLGTTNAGYLSAGTAYINVHTNAYPNGEIRGQIAALGKAAIPATTTGAASTTASQTAGASYIFGSIALMILSFAILA